MDQTQRDHAIEGSILNTGRSWDGSVSRMSLDSILIRDDLDLHAAPARGTTLLFR